MARTSAARWPAVAALAAVAAALLVFGVDGLKCPHACSQKGVCDYTTGVCTCFQGFAGTDCSQRGCPVGPAWFDFATAADTAHADAECSNNGLCDRSTGLCKCRPGFSGQACENIGCYKGCNGHGQCYDLEMAARVQDDRRLFTTTTYSLWDKNLACGCVCDEGYTGYDCSLRECPFGHDPLDTNEVDEEQVISCECDATCAGGIKLTFKGETTATIAYNAVAKITDENSAVTYAGTGRGESVQAKLEALRAIHGVGVSISGDGTLCQTTAATTIITFTHDPGDVPALVVTNDLATTGSVASVSVTADGTGSSVVGTKTSKECSGRGTCDRSTGECVCYDSFGPSDRTGGSGDVLDCGYNTTTITSCPGECSDHGTCSANSAWTCTCWEGYKGHDCNERQCPFGIAWWDEPSGSNVAHSWAECSNKGVCNVQTGECKCQPGFSGRACERLACPTSSNQAVCHGRGKCVTMGFAQHQKTINGDLVGDLEVQTFTCSATSGTIQLTFDGFTTSSIAFGATAATVKAALEALPTIGLVDVTFDTGSAVCAGGTITTSVTFVTEYGDQPEITSTSTGVSTTATEVTKGSRMTYGTNYLATTWDYNKVTGCLCDHDMTYNKSSALSPANTGDVLDYKGYDCSLRTCPTGSDPLSSATHVKEIQTVTCTASSGTFTITFRQQTTAALAYNIDNAAIQTALEGLKTIGDVTVSNANDVACSASGENWAVTFESELGDLPALTGASSAGTLTVAETQKGTTENVECSNRGICDTTTGVCKCVSGFVSGDSSGAGLAGARGDCGHQDALYKE